jgi:hypothetical protein
VHGTNFRSRIVAGPPLPAVDRRRSARANPSRAVSRTFIVNFRHFSTLLDVAIVVSRTVERCPAACRLE